MNKAKPWQLVVVILGFLALGVSLYFALTKETVQLADSVTLVDVETGQLYKSPFPSRRSVVYPATNPITKSDTLMPVDQVEGKWFIGELFRAQVAVMPKDKVKVVENLKSGEVKVLPGEPEPIDVW